MTETTEQIAEHALAGVPCCAPETADAPPASGEASAAAKTPEQQAAEWLSLAEKVYPNHIPANEDQLTPAEVVQLVPQVPVAVALQVLLLASDRDYAVTIFRDGSGVPQLGKIPTALYYRVLQTIQHEDEAFNARKLLVRFDAGRCHGGAKIEGLFITPAAVLNDLIGKTAVFDDIDAEVVIDEDCLTLVSDDDALISALAAEYINDGVTEFVESNGEVSNAQEGYVIDPPWITLSGYNPLEYLPVSKN